MPNFGGKVDYVEEIEEQDPDLAFEDEEEEKQPLGLMPSMQAAKPFSAPLGSKKILLASALDEMTEEERLAYNFPMLEAPDKLEPLKFEGTLFELLFYALSKAASEFDFDMHI